VLWEWKKGRRADEQQQQVGLRENGKKEEGFGGIKTCWKKQMKIINKQTINYNILLLC
jgi:hypothetical protein